MDTEFTDAPETDWFFFICDETLHPVNIIQEWIITTTKTLQSYKHDIQTTI